MAQKEEYVYLSCICTGYEEASRNDVLQIAVRDDAGNVLFDSLIKPAKRKRWDSYSHEITPESVRDSPTLSDVAPELQKLLRGKHVVLYNKKSLTLMTNHKLRKKYGFIPFSEELMSWLKRIALIFGVIVVLFVIAVIVFR